MQLFDFTICVMWVQPKFWQPIFILKPIRAAAYRFYYKNLRKRAVLVFFFWSEKICSGSFICSRNFFQSIFSTIRETEVVIRAI